MRIALVIPAAARGRASRLFWGVARGLAPVWIGPALVYNVDWTGAAGWAHNISAVFTILGSALLIDVAIRAKHWFMTPLLAAVALFMVYGNTKQAARTLSLGGEAMREAKLAEIAGGSHLASQRSQLETRRKAQVQLAGEAPVATLEAELEAAKNSDPSRWAATSQCEDVSLKASGNFCARVNVVKGKIAAAKARDQIDADLRALPVPKMVAPKEGQEAPVADGYVANIKAIANELGYQPSERLIVAEEALTRALQFELLAAFGPGCHLFAINLILGFGAHVSSVSTRLRNMSKKSKKAAISKPVKAVALNSADTIDRWMADDLEDGTGSLPSKELRALCKAWCEVHKVDVPDENELWARMRARFKHDPNNGRPRYLGVKRRQKGPVLVVSN